MTYGSVASATTIGTGVVLLPETGNNMVIMIVAASLIVLGTGVFVASWLLSRKKRQADVL